ncbi:hypothetical protein B7R22_15490 [Subtercola boreus]|uniref:Uncharacterized protein n=1 Tax=Subtercola boreus TaxID=120213 RepID=A0A3E0VSG1_9MICO|nr:hypothetical protein [Subtercola boreus]RFA12520.1 hypothetical protein B7R22_15490 [Subtercola boreus]
MLVTAWTVTALLLTRDAALAVLLCSIAVLVALAAVAATVAIVLAVSGAVRGARGPVRQESPARASGPLAQRDARVPRSTQPPRVDIDTVIAAMEAAFAERAPAGSAVC